MPNVMSIAKKIAADGIAAAIVTNAGMIHLPGSIPFSTDLSSGIEMTAAIDLSRYAMGEPVEFSLTSLADDILYNTLASYVSSYVMPDVRGMLGEYGIPDEAAKILGMGSMLFVVQEGRDLMEISSSSYLRMVAHPLQALMNYY